MKKLFVLLLAALMVFGMVACGNNNAADDGDKKADLKVGFIFLHDEQSTYDKNFIDAAVEACKKMNVQMVRRSKYRPRFSTSAVRS